MGFGNILGSGNDMLIVLVIIFLLFNGDSGCFGSSDDMVFLIIIILLLFCNNGFTSRTC